ncbi:calpain-A [Trichonephila clavipes]|nr:calpain-A [Trichonephila clavipes]
MGERLSLDIFNVHWLPHHGGSSEVKDPVRQTVQNFLHIEEIGNSGPYVNYREVFGRFQMNPGHYIIVPATYEPDSPGSFYMRVYSDTQISLREL